MIDTLVNFITYNKSCFADYASKISNIPVTDYELYADIVCKFIKENQHTVNLQYSLQKYNLTSVTTDQTVKRAKIEEAYVREILPNILSYTYDIILPGKQDDWNHSDIIARNTETNEEIHIDVKRSSSTNFASPNFSFTFVNRKGEEYPFRENGYFIFIDEVAWKIIYINQLYIKDYIYSNRYRHKTSGNSKYILIEKQYMYDLSKEHIDIIVIDIDLKSRAFLERNRNESLF